MFFLVHSRLIRHEQTKGKKWIDGLSPFYLKVFSIENTDKKHSQAFVNSVAKSFQVASLEVLRLDRM